MYKNEELTLKKTHCQGPQHRLEGNLSIEDGGVAEIKVVTSSYVKDSDAYGQVYEYTTTLSIERVVYKFVAYISGKDIDTYLKDHQYNFEESIKDYGFSFQAEKMLIIHVVRFGIIQYFTRYN